ncbi:carboxylesterase/lipase family protein [Paenibacillus sp.]|uniref:carboxylesterase/lipase family protein n=1 Tax=Paenibacillus sp. TaxID=58172 RepID=UPI002D476BBE|nr:carboxylesterase/lipase family protein [Paenibacillus sp.]HZG87991.1 carboxylesterase/lipase family protein [Paenibacillus sp.]
MNLIVTTEKGKVRGIETENVLAWYGIPFGKAPVGELRFKRAQPAEAWDDVKDCTSYGNDPVQFIGAREKEDEDCLHVNVWAPKDAVNLPVLVWFYGGGLHYGFNSDPSYDGARMASNGVIRVNINFRLGPLGYYDFNQYDDSFDTNCTLSDQIEGLKWVQENIAAFGGDPGNITIFGESGGGTAVYHLLASPAAKGLFHKAIIQSGLPELCGRRAFSKLLVPHFLDYIGLQPEEVFKLKTIDILKIKEAGSNLYRNFSTLYDGVHMPGAYIGDDLLPEYPWTAIKNGSAAGVDVIIGYTRDEGDTFIQSTNESNAWFPSWECVEGMLENNGKGEYYTELRSAYSDIGDDREALSNFVTDYLFAKEAYRFADYQVNHGKVWMYRFDFVPVAYKHMNMGAVHAVDIPFALDTLDRGYFANALKGTPQDQTEAVRDQMNGAFLNFAKTGNPDGGIIDWPKYEGENSLVHLFDLQPTNQDVRLNEKIFRVWGKIGVVYDSDEMFQHISSKAIGNARLGS